LNSAVFVVFLID